jgi:CheY-like chemotaxis protein
MTKILLVEDDKSLREIYGVRLLAEGYDIVSAGDGEEALAMAIKERPQLIVSDVMMPKISGFDMLDILRSTSETRDIKVIMMTALSSEDQRARGEALGADRYLVKSQVGIEDVVRTVHDVLGDSLVVPPTPAQTFGTPAPSAVARPVAPVAPRPVEPVVAPQPVAMPQPMPVAQPAPAPIAAPQPVVAAPVYAQPVFVPPPVINAPAPVGPAPIAAQPYITPEQTSAPMPQPTAPFSSDRPASLGDRVIHPLTDQQPAVDVGHLMNQELHGATDAFSLPTQPPVPPAPTDFNTPSAPQNF